MGGDLYSPLFQFLSATSAALTPSKKTWLCVDVFAEAQKGRIDLTMSGN